MASENLRMTSDYEFSYRRYEPYTGKEEWVAVGEVGFHVMADKMADELAYQSLCRHRQTKMLIDHSEKIDELLVCNANQAQIIERQASDSVVLQNAFNDLLHKKPQVYKFGADGQQKETTDYQEFLGWVNGEIVNLHKTIEQQDDLINILDTEAETQCGKIVELQNSLTKQTEWVDFWKFTADRAAKDLSTSQCAEQINKDSLYYWANQASGLGDVVLDNEKLIEQLKAGLDYWYKEWIKARDTLNSKTDAFEIDKLRQTEKIEELSNELDATRQDLKNLKATAHRINDGWFETVQDLEGQIKLLKAERDSKK